jgi:hypothetical protein
MYSEFDVKFSSIVMVKHAADLKVMKMYIQQVLENGNGNKAIFYVS